MVLLLEVSFPPAGFFFSCIFVISWVPYLSVFCSCSSTLIWNESDESELEVELELELELELKLDELELELWLESDLLLAPSSQKSTSFSNVEKWGKLIAQLCTKRVAKKRNIVDLLILGGEEYLSMEATVSKQRLRSQYFTLYVRSHGNRPTCKVPDVRL